MLPQVLLPQVLLVLVSIQLAESTASASPAALSAPSCATAPGHRASCYTSRWLQPPKLVPSGHSTDGPVIGNGDMGVVATGNAGEIQLYTGKNDFWATRDVPSGGCAYALMGSGSLEIAAPTAAAPPSPPGPPLRISHFKTAVLPPFFSPTTGAFGVTLAEKSI